MPLYEYKCRKCGHEFEALQKVNDKPLETCPKCGGLLRKLISPPAIQFKGNGWYITDYAKKTGSAPEGQGQAKPEAKREPAKEKEAAPNPPASAKD